MNVIPIVSRCSMLTVTTLGIPSSQEGTHGLKAVQACSLQNYFASCLVSILYICLSHIFTHTVLASLSHRETFALSFDPLN